MKLSQNEITEKLISIISSWRSIGAKQQSRTILYPVGENCIWSYGITEKGTFSFYLESPIPFGCGRQLCTKNIQSEEVKADGVWFLQLELLEIDDLSIFAKLIEDLISESMKCDDDSKCIRCVVERFELWRNMMSHASQHKAEEKGLWGELYTLRQIISHMPVLEAIRAWTGPEYEVQDFKFADNWIEVKTVGSNAFVARISSIKQLMSTNVGYLHVVYADEDEIDEAAETVHELYNDICSALEEEPTKEALSLFNDKIREFKYLGFVSEDRTRFLYKGERTFEVTSTFPHLDICGDALSIGSVVYDLKLDTLKEWEIDDIWQRL